MMLSGSWVVIPSVGSVALGLLPAEHLCLKAEVMEEHICLEDDAWIF